MVFFYFNFPFWTFLFARQLSFYPCLRPLSFRRCDLICECICVLSVDSIFFGFSLPSPVSVIICNSDYLYCEREREREKWKKKTTRGKSSNRGTQSIVVPWTLPAPESAYTFTLGSYIEFLIRFSIEWHFINLFYLSSLFRLSLFSFIFPFSV